MERLRTFLSRWRLPRARVWQISAVTGCLSILLTLLLFLQRSSTAPVELEGDLANSAFAERDPYVDDDPFDTFGAEPREQETSFRPMDDEEDFPRNRRPVTQTPVLDILPGPDGVVADDEEDFRPPAIAATEPAEDEPFAMPAPAANEREMVATAPRFSAPAEDEFRPEEPAFEPEPAPALTMAPPAPRNDLADPGFPPEDEPFEPAPEAMPAEPSAPRSPRPDWNLDEDGFGRRDDARDPRRVPDPSYLDEPAFDNTAEPIVVEMPADEPPVVIPMDHRPALDDEPFADPAPPADRDDDPFGQRERPQPMTSPRAPASDLRAPSAAELFKNSRAPKPGVDDDEWRFRSDDRDRPTSPRSLPDEVGEAQAGSQIRVSGPSAQPVMPLDDEPQFEEPVVREAPSGPLPEPDDEFEPEPAPRETAPRMSRPAPFEDPEESFRDGPEPRAPREPAPVDRFPAESMPRDEEPYPPAPVSPQPVEEEPFEPEAPLPSRPGDSVPLPRDRYLEDDAPYQPSMPAEPERFPADEAPVGRPFEPDDSPRSYEPEEPVAPPADPVVPRPAAEPQGGPQLKIEVQAPRQVRIGEPVVLDFRISNVGDAPALGVVATDLVPRELKHPESNDLIYPIGRLNPGESRSTRLRLAAVEPGTAVNRAVVTADGGISADSVARVEVVSGTQSSLEPGPLGGPHGVLTHRGPDVWYYGQIAAFTTTIGNPTSQARRNMRVEQTVPAGTRFVSASAGGRYDPQRHAVVWTIDHLPPGERITLSAELRAADVGPLVSVTRLFVNGSEESRQQFPSQIQCPPGVN